MAMTLVIAGLVLIVAGIVWTVWPIKPLDAASRGGVKDLAELLEQINKLLDKFDKRYRPGILLMVIGVTLIVLGVFFVEQPVADPESLSVLLGLALAP